MNEEKPESATALEIAMLAALIAPAACREGNCRDALFRAMALFQESAALCDEMAKQSHREQIEMLASAATQGDQGAGRLLFAMSRTRKQPLLTLGMRDDEQDTLRPYLETHCNLEGTKGRKSWGGIRTVLKNLRCWTVFTVNNRNTSNAASIQAREVRDEAEARAKGCSVEELNAAGRSSYQDERWQDAERAFEEFLASYAVLENGQPAGYSFPQQTVDLFIAWKRWIRSQKGGMGAVHPRPREEVLPNPIKKKNPKRGG